MSNGSVSKKSADATTQRMKELCWLTDWRITTKVVPGFVPDDGHLGDAEITADYKTASITLYPDAIAADPKCTELDVLVHEFGEIIAAECCLILAQETYESDSLVRVRDRFAEHFALIMERAFEGGLTL